MQVMYRIEIILCLKRIDVLILLSKGTLIYLVLIRFPFTEFPVTIDSTACVLSLLKLYPFQSSSATRLFLATVTQYWVLTHRDKKAQQGFMAMSHGCILKVLT